MIAIMQGMFDRLFDGARRVVADAGTVLFRTGDGVQSLYRLSSGAVDLRRVTPELSQREAQVLAAWKDGLREPEEMLPVVYEDTPEKAWPLAKRQILAHLERLEKAGKRK